MNFSFDSNESGTKLTITYEGISLEGANKIIETLKTITLDNDLEYRCIELIKTGNKLMAIKTYKDETGKDLKTSKDYIDSLALKHNL